MMKNRLESYTNTIFYPSLSTRFVWPHSIIAFLLIIADSTASCQNQIIPCTYNHGQQHYYEMCKITFSKKPPLWLSLKDTQHWLLVPHLVNIAFWTTWVSHANTCLALPCGHKHEGRLGVARQTHCQNQYHIQIPSIGSPFLKHIRVNNGEHSDKSFERLLYNRLWQEQVLWGLSSEISKAMVRITQDCSADPRSPTNAFDRKNGGKVLADEQPLNPLNTGPPGVNMWKQNCRLLAPCCHVLIAAEGIVCKWQAEVKVTLTPGPCNSIAFSPRPAPSHHPTSTSQHCFKPSVLV